MTWLTPLAARTVGMVALVAAALVVIAYLLKMRRRRFEVPFSSLWKRVLEQRDANSLWRQLRRLLSLLLLLAIVGLVVVAIQAPTLGVTDRRARNVVILLDTSASMRATDGDPARPKLTRFERAQERAAALIDTMGGGDQAMIMRVDAQATPLSRFASDKPLLRKVIDEVRPSDTGADLPRALSAAADALRGRPNPMIVIVSDGAYSELERDQVTWDAAEADPAGAARRQAPAATATPPPPPGPGRSPRPSWPRSTSPASTCATSASAPGPRTSASSRSTCGATSPTRPATRSSSRSRTSAPSRPAASSRSTTATPRSRSRRSSWPRASASARSTGSCPAARASCARRCARSTGPAAATRSRSTTRPGRSCPRARSSTCCS
ncbi:MAG: VWA domain-containing protein [Myxococcales bacterium]|nr:VWA domain-containing protein [Myxococcales bacterium]